MLLSSERLSAWRFGSRQMQRTRSGNSVTQNKIEVRPSEAPVVTGMRVVPVAGQDSMLLNLSGAHAPFFTRNLVFLKDSTGNMGVGEVQGVRRFAKCSKILVRLWRGNRSQHIVLC